RRPDLAVAAALGARRTEARGYVRARHRARELRRRGPHDQSAVRAEHGEHDGTPAPRHSLRVRGRARRAGDRERGLVAAYPRLPGGRALILLAREAASSTSSAACG